ncbi:SH3 domain-containing protein [Belnapia sp. T6]|uniref:SH3 domain-containing protein n=1 Tax=Belnapia mucosa TaxID=2804532 RepID=A0ABS1UWI6_9PROT|nr:SH3 domain-containing protein [Belnapia mucosa]MBL6453836.1 SH3 domain-containing protein [Belnapia mucosa]
MSSRPVRRLTASLTAFALLAGCATGRNERIGADDGSDACRPQLVALDSTGNYYAEDIIRGAAIGAVSGGVLGGLIGAAATGRTRDIAIGAGAGVLAGGAVGAAGGYLAARQRQAQDQASLSAAVGGDLASENAQLDRTQLAFNQLVDCRLMAAETIRQDVRSGRLAPEAGRAQMAALRGRMQQDIAIARRINDRIGTRGAEFDTAIDAVAPGTRQDVAARQPAPAPARTRAPVPLRIRPEPSAPQIDQVAANEPVTVRPVQGNYALVETSSGIRGYAPASSFPGRRPAAVPAPTGGDGSVRELAASNIAKRDNFSESVTNAERVAGGQGFELAS